MDKYRPGFEQRVRGAESDIAAQTALAEHVNPSVLAALAALPDTDTRNEVINAISALRVQDTVGGEVDASDRDLQASMAGVMGILYPSKMSLHDTLWDVVHNGVNNLVNMAEIIWEIEYGEDEQESPAFGVRAALEAFVRNPWAYRALYKRSQYARERPAVLKMNKPGAAERMGGLAVSLVARVRHKRRPFYRY